MLHILTGDKLSSEVFDLFKVKLKKSSCGLSHITSLYFPADLVVVALQLLMKTLVALLHLLLVADQRCEAMQRTRVQIISVTPHNPTQRLRLTNHLRP